MTKVIYQEKVIDEFDNWNYSLICISEIWLIVNLSIKWLSNNYP